MIELFATQMAAMQPGVAEDRLQPLVQATSLLREMEPQNATETMLAVQMFGVHNAAVNFLRESSREGQTNDGSDGKRSL